MVSSKVPKDGFDIPKNGMEFYGDKKILMVNFQGSLGRNNKMKCAASPFLKFYLYFISGSHFFAAVPMPVP
jgi:hypothetical protein